MIRHTPHGRGHAYRPSLDQRVPVVPLAGQDVQVRALVEEDALAVHVEHRVGDGPVARTPAEPLPTTSDGADGADGGHLAAAAAAGEQVEGMRPVAVDLVMPDVQPLAYRWCTATEGGPWTIVHPAAWRAGEDGILRAEGLDDRLDGPVEVLDAGTGPVRLRFAVRLDPGDHVLGLGERFHALDHRGRRLDATVFEQYKQQGERTYLPVPFVLVVGGGPPWGLHVATTRRCWFDIGASDPDRLVVEVAVTPEEPTVTVHGWTDDEPAGVLQAFWSATGTPAAVPRWVFRPWGSGNEWNTQERVEAEVARSLAEDVPLGVIVIEAWSDEATFTAFRDADHTPTTDGGPLRLEDFTFPADGAWPDPKGMVDALHAQDVKVLLWQIPLLPVDVPEDRLGAVQLAHDRRALVERGLAVREADGSPYHNRGWWFPGALMPDLTNPEAVRWWIDKRRYLLTDLGIDGFKTDGGEHAWGDELRWADGTRGDVTNNTFPNRYAQAYHQLLAETGTDGITFSRAGHTGAGTTPCHWAGDEDSTWPAFRASILAGLSAGVSGVSAWGFDHGGFSGEIPSVELYLRSAAVAMLCPIMQYHSEFNHHRTPCRDRTPWNIAERHGAPEVLTTYRRFAHIRERLVDYLHDQHERGRTQGLPLMRTLALRWPDDPAIWDHPHQYLLGDHLLVAPVVEPDRARWTAHLPAGTWVDAWDGSRVEGGSTVTVDAPLDRVPAWTTDTPEGAALRAAFLGPG